MENIQYKNPIIEIKPENATLSVQEKKVLSEIETILQKIAELDNEIQHCTYQSQSEIAEENSHEVVGKRLQKNSFQEIEASEEIISTLIQDVEDLCGEVNNCDDQYQREIVKPDCDQKVIEELNSKLDRMLVQVQANLQKSKDQHQLLSAENEVFEENLHQKGSPLLRKIAAMEAEQKNLQQEARKLIEANLTKPENLFNKNLKILEKLVNKQSEQGFFLEIQDQPKGEKLSKQEVLTLAKNNLTKIIRIDSEIQEVILQARRNFPKQHVLQDEDIGEIKKRISENSIPMGQIRELRRKSNDLENETLKLINNSYITFDSQFNRELDEHKKLVERATSHKELGDYRSISKAEHVLEDDLQKLFDALTNRCVLECNVAKGMIARAELFKDLVSTLLTDSSGKLKQSYSLSCLQKFLGQLSMAAKKDLISYLYSLAQFELQLANTKLKQEQQQRAMEKQQKKNSLAEKLGSGSFSFGRAEKDRSPGSSAYLGAHALTYFFICAELEDIPSLCDLAEMHAKKDFPLPDSDEINNYAGLAEGKALLAKDAKTLFNLGMLHKEVNFSPKDAGRCFFNAKQLGFDAAISELKNINNDYLKRITAIAVEKKNIDQLCNIGLWHQDQMGLKENAKQCFELAQKIAEDSSYRASELLFNLGKWHNDNTSSPDAKLYFKKAEDIAVTRSEAFFLLQLGTWYIQNEAPTDAQRCVKAAEAAEAAEKSHSPEFLFKLSMWHMENTPGDESTRCLLKAEAMAEKSGNATFLFKLAKWHKDNDHVDDSTRCLLAAETKAEKTNESEFLFELGKWHKDNGLVEDSARCFAKAETTAKAVDNAECLFNLGKWYMTNKSQPAAAARCWIAAAQLEHEGALWKCEDYKIDVPQKERCSIQ